MTRETRKTDEEFTHGLEGFFDGSFAPGKKEHVTKPSTKKKAKALARWPNRTDAARDGTGQFSGRKKDSGQPKTKRGEVNPPKSLITNGTINGRPLRFLGDDGAPITRGTGQDAVPRPRNARRKP